MFVFRSTYDRAIAERDAAREDSRLFQCAAQNITKDRDLMRRQRDEARADLAKVPQRDAKGRMAKRVQA